MKKIVQKEDKVLRKIAKEVSVSDIKSDKIQNLLKEMKRSLAGEKDGVALAAPQIAESLRIFVISPIAYESLEEKYPEEKLFFINPKIIWM